VESPAQNWQDQVNLIFLEKNVANQLLTISKITNEALMVLENELTFTSEVDRNYDDQFAVV
jgi:hypothetical protein